MNENKSADGATGAGKNRAARREDAGTSRKPGASGRAGAAGSARTSRAAGSGRASEESSAQSNEGPSVSSGAGFGGFDVDDIVGDIALEMLGRTELGKGLMKALEVFESIQEDLVALSEQKDNQMLLVLKVGTILTFSLTAKTRGGTAISDLTGDDLKDIYENVSHYAIRMDGQLYSVFIFAMYADYIDASQKIVEPLCRPEEAEQVHELAEELREQARRIANGEVPEADGTETCLWLVLEALVKLLCLYCGAPLGNKQQVVTALGQLAFEVGRCQLYARELEVVSQCVDRQHELDEELEQKYQMYIADVREASTRLMSLVSDAFSPDFEERLKGSVALAKEMGVESEKVLDTQEKIDAYFLE